MSTSSPWLEGVTLASTKPLSHTEGCDVCVVGGGIAGLTTAYLLAESGRSVVLLEANDTVASGETAFTTAHLSWVIDDRFAHLASVRGDDVARIGAGSHRSAIDFIREVVTRERIDCDFERVDGYLFNGETNVSIDLDREEESLRKLGIEYERVAASPLPGLTAGPCLRFAGQAQFHPLKYLAGLTTALHERGGVIHTGTRVESISGGTPCQVKTSNGQTLSAKAVVVATGSPFDSGVVLHTKLAAYNTYAVGLEVPAGTVPHALFWDMEDPYHYVRVQPGGTGSSTDLLIVGGEDHKTGQADDQAARWDRLVAWTRKRVPQAGAVKHHWSGQVFETPDGLGLIGRAPWGENIYVITGDSGMGMTHGTLGGRLVTTLIRGESDPLARVFDPNRWMPGALKTLFQENANVVAQYTDWLTGGDVSSIDQIPPGQGAVVRCGLTKHAVYRDEKGTATEMTSVCPHMGGLVRWNPGEKTWDCPCHGSRFSATGEVMHGPAVEGLKLVTKK